MDSKHLCYKTKLTESSGKKLSEMLDHNNEGFFHNMAELFKILGDPTRIKILLCLQAGEMCVCDLAGFLSASHSAVSHQLRILRTSRLVKYRRSGRLVFYSINDEHVNSLLKQAADHVNE